MSERLIHPLVSHHTHHRIQWQSSTKTTWNHIPKYFKSSLQLPWQYPVWHAIPVTTLFDLQRRTTWRLRDHFNDKEITGSGATRCLKLERTSKNASSGSRMIRQFELIVWYCKTHSVTQLLERKRWPVGCGRTWSTARRFEVTNKPNNKFRYYSTFLTSREPGTDTAVPFTEKRLMNVLTVPPWRWSRIYAPNCIAWHPKML